MRYLPNTAQNQRALVAWQAAEGASAAFNPLARRFGQKTWRPDEF